MCRQIFAPASKAAWCKACASGERFALNILRPFIYREHGSFEVAPLRFLLSPTRDLRYACEFTNKGRFSWIGRSLLLEVNRGVRDQRYKFYPLRPPNHLDGGRAL
jgi:hypothetical protein